MGQTQFQIVKLAIARTLFPRIMAFDDDSEEQEDAAQLMSDLIEWSVIAAEPPRAVSSVKASHTRVSKP